MLKETINIKKSDVSIGKTRLTLRLEFFPPYKEFKLILPFAPYDEDKEGYIYAIRHKVYKEVIGSYIIKENVILMKMSIFPLGSDRMYLEISKKEEL